MNLKPPSAVCMRFYPEDAVVRKCVFMLIISCVWLFPLLSPIFPIHKQIIRLSFVRLLMEPDDTGNTEGATLYFIILDPGKYQLIVFFFSCLGLGSAKMRFLFTFQWHFCLHLNFMLTKKKYRLTPNDVIYEAKRIAHNFVINKLKLISLSEDL